MALSVCHNSVTSWVLLYQLKLLAQFTVLVTRHGIPLQFFAVWRRLQYLLYPFIKHFHMYSTILSGVRL